MQDTRELVPPALEVALRITERETLSGILVHRQVVHNGSYAVIDFEQSRAPRLPIGARVSLVFGGEQIDPPRELSGEVVFRSENELLQRYQFFLGPEARDPLTSGGNRRRAVRVEPDPSAPVLAFLQASAGATRAEIPLADVSARGVRLILTSDLDARFCSSSRLLVSLRLPDDPSEVVFRAFVRYRARVADEIHYGVEFDAQATTDFEERQGRVAMYVLARQTELDSAQPVAS